MMRIRTAVFFVLAMFVCVASEMRAADPAFEHDADYIRNELRCAATGLRAIAVAAHPDDEDGATLSYLRYAGVETHIVYSTRGEGGQNEAGPEAGAKLALLRTKEIEEAAAIVGARAWYLNLPDFGFSKSVDETVGVWNHDVALERMVRILRTVRPHIAITNHNPDGTDHGHHRTTGKLLVEAFDAAADATKFPKQFEQGLKPWSIARIYLRTFTAQGATFNVDVSKRDGVSGLSPSEIGAFALSRHFSQGMLRDLRVGERELRHFSVLKGRTPGDSTVKNMLDGIAIAPEVGLQFAADIADGIDLKKLDAGTLAREIVLARNPPHMQGAQASEVHLNRALVAALGLKVEVRCDDEFIVGGEVAPISVRIANQGLSSIGLVKISLKPRDMGWTLAKGVWSPDKPQKLNSGGVETVELSAGAGIDVPLSYPQEDHLFSNETTVAPLIAEVLATVEMTDEKGKRSVDVTLEAHVPLTVAPPFTFTVSPSPLLIFSDPNLANEDKEAAHFKLLARCNKKIKDPIFLSATIGEKPKEGETGKVLPLNFKGDTAVWSFNQWFSIEKLNAGITIQTNVWDANGFYKTPEQTIRRVALDVPNNLRVALIRGVDEQLYNAFKRMQDAGVGRGTFSFEAPTDDDLLTGDLNKYQTIVLDIRSTQQRPIVRKIKDRFKTFMEDGGTVVCMYQKDFDWNDRSKDPAVRGVGMFRGVGGGGEIAPFPIDLSFDRITREDAPVTILRPAHQLMLRPCRLWQKDFEGWAQERGAYFPRTWADEYTPLLTSHDPGEKALDGGLLVADVGRGGFIYTSYFLQHQFRTGVPGAYRLLANLLSYSRLKRAEK